MLPQISVIGLTGIPEVVAGDDLSAFIVAAARQSKFEIHRRDVFVVAQKVVSKAEGRIVELNTVEPSPQARVWAEEFDKDARIVEVVLRESRRIVRQERGVMICETHHGFICANAGVDHSNIAPGFVVLLPEDPDASARRLQAALEQAFGVGLAVIVSDTFGRPWREGLVNVALGVAGIAPLIDYRGQRDSYGQVLRVTMVAVADEIASATELVMNKSDNVPVAIVRGLAYEQRDASASELIRPTENDLFR
ncbi:MAG: coenzyme F420-0:L-glutamate ligase [Acidobacteria bacterium]|nr:coenzyme F420-0:L-glutamate ligase [Acidobacteriota bacterium]